MKVTLKVIAEEAGVSQMTVSRILRGKSDGQVSGSVRERVVSALTAHSYDFQKTARKSAALRKTPEKKIVSILPYSSFLSHPPHGNSLIFYRFLDEYCRKNNIRLKHIVGLCSNNASIPAWEELQKIPAGTPVLFHSSYGLTAAIALQQQGCRVGLVLRDLFWRNFYAPQLKKMSCFTMKTAEGIAQTIRAMHLAGCRKIACGALKNFLAEPGYPVLAGYDYERRINDISYRHVIPLAGYNKRAHCDTIRKAYAAEPFDGLFVPSPTLELCGDLRKEAGLPASVKLASCNVSDQAAAESQVDFNARFSYEEILADAVGNLLDENFKAVQKSYNCCLLSRQQKSAAFCSKHSLYVLRGVSHV